MGIQYTGLFVCDAAKTSQLVKIANTNLVWIGKVENCTSSFSAAFITCIKSWPLVSVAFNTSINPDGGHPHHQFTSVKS